MTTHRIIEGDVPNGQLNQAMSTHKTRSSLISDILRTIREIGGSDGTKAKESALVTALEAKMYDREKILAAIQQMAREGKLSEPRAGLWKIES